MLALTNTLGAATAILFYLSAIFVFVFRLLHKPRVEKWIGILEFLLAVPLIYLLIQAPKLDRPAIYTIQIACMLAWLVASAVLDYIFKIEFRKVRWMVIAYVMLFFAGTGGMLGVAANAGPAWSAAAIALFLIMAVLTFVQRAVTGQ